MHPLLASALMATALIGLPALAQTAPAASTSDASRYDRAPWWTGQPVMASSGYVETEVAANRASFSANFQSVAKTAPEATKAAADQVRALSKTLGALGADRARVETSLSMQPLYEQYRDKEGNLQTNVRADKIERYQVNANLSIEVRDLRLLEQVYAAVLAARPNGTGAVGFGLKPDNETKTQMFKLAVIDAARRAKLSAEATGATLGRIKLIDPTGRACETDVLLAGAPRGSDPGYAYDVPAPPEPMMARSAPMQDMALEVEIAFKDMMLSLQPPLQTLSARACVVYALGS
jgi:uncharacterized protein YggE